MLSWATMLVLARLLDPKDYGIVGMATIFVGLGGMVVDMGIGAAAVTLRHLTASQLSQLHAVSLVLGIVTFVVGWISAPSLADFYAEPRLTSVFRALSLLFALSAARTIPVAVLRRDLDFRRIAISESVGAGFGACVSLGMAFLGYGYWSLVLAQVAGALATLVTLPRFGMHHMRAPSAQDTRESLVFGARSFVGHLSWYTYSNADFLVAGRLLGAGALGTYTLAWTLVNLPMEKIGQIISSVMPALLASMRDELDRSVRVLLLATEATSIVVFPITVGLAATADLLVPLVLGLKWAESVPVIRALAVYATIRSIAPPLNALLFNNRQERFMMYLGVIAAVVFPVSFFVGAKLNGGEGIAQTWSAVYPFLFAATAWRASKVGMLSLTTYAKSLLPAAVSCVAMLVSLAVLSSVLRIESAVLALSAKVLLGALTYIGTLFAVFPDRFSYFSGFVLRAVKRRA